MTMAHSNKKIDPIDLSWGGGNIFWTARSLSKTEFLMERHKFLPPCMSENIAGCVRNYSSQLVRVLFLSFCILVREVSSYHHISKKIVWKYYYTTISIWSPTNSGVKISVTLKGSESAIIFAHLFGGLAPTDLFVSKKHKIWKFSIRVNFET